MKVRISLLALSLVVLSAAGARAHEGKTHVMGTVTTVDAEHLVIKNRDGQSVSMHITKNTTFHKGDAPAAAGDLKAGDRVVVDVVGKDADLTATEIRVGTGSAEPAHSGEPRHGEKP